MANAAGTVAGRATAEPAAEFSLTANPLRPPAPAQTNDAARLHRCPRAGVAFDSKTTAADFCRGQSTHNEGSSIRQRHDIAATDTTTAAAADAREAAGSCRRTTVPHAGSSPDTPPTGARTGAAAVPARPKLKATLVLSRGRGGERVAPPRRYEVAIPTLPRGQIPPPGTHAAVRMLGSPTALAARAATIQGDGRAYCIKHAQQSNAT
ncbi:unnamed protein product [Lampetra fluviatilis]